MRYLLISLLFMACASEQPKESPPLQYNDAMAREMLSDVKELTPAQKSARANDMLKEARKMRSGCVKVMVYNKLISDLPDTRQAGQAKSEASRVYSAERKKFLSMTARSLRKATESEIDGIVSELEELSRTCQDEQYSKMIDEIAATVVASRVEKYGR